MKTYQPRLCVSAVILTLTVLLTTAANADDEMKKHEYPTAVIADYVLGCMAANGNSYEALHQCSCSIDFIRERLTFAEYEQTQTVMQVQLDRGQRGMFYRDSNWAKSRVEALQKIQAESTLRCF